jgi:hypothetical protein
MPSDARRRSQPLQLTKLDVAQRQLHTALTLWFADGDSVSIHTLAFAAYEIVHAISKKLNPQRQGLIFDSRIITPEARKSWNRLIKRPAAFFKHANNDPNDTLEFRPEMSELFIIFTIYGLSLCEVSPTQIQNAFLWWIGCQDPNLLSAEANEFLLRRAKIEEPQRIAAGMTRGQFLQQFLERPWTK